MESVGADDEVALDRVAVGHADPRPLAVEVVQRHAVHLEPHVAAGVEAGGDQVLHDLLLAVDRDRPSGQPGEVDAMPLAGKAKLGAVMP